MTEKQFKYIEDLYKEEMVRDESLSKKAQVYLSINSLLITALVFKAKDLKELLVQPSGLESLLVILTFIFIFISFLAIILALAIYRYERPTDVQTLIDEQDKGIEDSDFIENRASDFIVAFEKNSRIGDKKANFLMIALIGLVLSFGSGIILMINLVL